MKYLIVLTLLSLDSYPVFANDVGFYYLPVEKLKSEDPKARREYAENTEVLITFEGKKADVFRRSLPKTITLDKDLEKSQNEILFIDKKSHKALLFSCTNSEFDWKTAQIRKLKTTRCVVGLIKGGNDDDYRQLLSEVTELKAPPMCIR